MVTMPGDKEIIQCPHWKDASNLKSDFRDQIIGNNYCALDLTEHDKQVRKEVLDTFEKIIHLHDVEELRYADLYNEFLITYKSLHKEQQQ